MEGALEAASLPVTASARGLVTAPLGPLESVETRAYADATDIATFANRLALGLAAGLIAVLIHGEAGRLSSENLTWRALLGP
jgi:hypothetical protein